MIPLTGILLRTNTTIQPLAPLGTSAVHDFASGFGAIPDQKSVFAFALHNGRIVLSFDEPHGQVNEGIPGNTGQSGDQW